jgi:FSR family fosmidomycin resistance protein-like MFS transporter
LSIPAAETSVARRRLAAACTAHAMHDGLIDAVLVLLPIFQAQFSLSYGLVGLLRSLAVGTMAVAQIPMAHLAGRFGSRAILAFGTIVAGTGYLVSGAGFGVAGVIAGLALLGLGASTQHPVASELVAVAREGKARRLALGFYNFAGDIGKTSVPPLAALALLSVDWRLVCLFLFAAALVVGLAIFFALPPDAPSEHAVVEPDGSASPNTKPFRLLVGIGIFDSGARMAFLTFLPFLLAARGGTVETTGLALSLLFAGGAAGKFACGWLGARMGAIPSVLLTEIATAVSIVVVALAPLRATMILLPFLGMALNGTSSILYGSVAELVPEAARRRAFSIFYTAVIGSSAAAPVLAGALVDHTDLTTMLFATAFAALCVVPLALALRPAFQAPLSGASTSPSL